MRRMQNALPAVVQRRIRRYDEWNRKLRAVNKELTAFKRSHRIVLTEHSKLQRDAERARRQKEGLLADLEWLDVPNIPYLFPAETSDSSEDEDASSWETAIVEGGATDGDEAVTRWNAEVDAL